MNVTEQLIDAGLVNREFSIEEAAKALNVDLVTAILWIGSELARNDDLVALFYDADGNQYDDLAEIDPRTPASTIKIRYYLHVYIELETKFNRILRTVILVTGIICFSILVGSVIINGIK